MATGRKVKQAKPKLTKAAFRAKVKGIRPRGHVHPLPVCSGGKHDVSCKDKGTEVLCKVVKLPKIPIKFAACAHIKL